VRRPAAGARGGRPRSRLMSSHGGHVIARRTRPAAPRYTQWWVHAGVGPGSPANAVVLRRQLIIIGVARVAPRRRPGANGSTARGRGRMCRGGRATRWWGGVAMRRQLCVGWVVKCGALACIGRLRRVGVEIKAMQGAWGVTALLGAPSCRPAATPAPGQATRVPQRAGAGARGAVVCTGSKESGRMAPILGCAKPIATRNVAASSSGAVCKAVAAMATVQTGRTQTTGRSTTPLRTPRRTFGGERRDASAHGCTRCPPPFPAPTPAALRAAGGPALQSRRAPPPATPAAGQTPCPGPPQHPGGRARPCRDPRAHGGRGVVSGIRDFSAARESTGSLASWRAPAKGQRRPTPCPMTPHVFAARPPCQHSTRARPRRLKVKARMEVSPRCQQPVI
jgi:hypothetical protein